MTGQKRVGYSMVHFRCTLSKVTSISIISFTLGISTKKFHLQKGWSASARPPKYAPKQNVKCDVWAYSKISPLVSLCPFFQ